MASRPLRPNDHERSDSGAILQNSRKKKQAKNWGCGGRAADKNLAKSGFRLPGARIKEETFDDNYSFAEGA